MNNTLITLLVLLVTISSLSIKAQEDAFNFEANVRMVPLEQGSFSLFDYGKGPVVILLHGFPDTKEVWKNQVVALVNAGYRVIAPDLQGRGASCSTKKWPLGKYLIELESIDKLGQPVKDVALTTLYS